MAEDAKSTGGYVFADPQIESRGDERADVREGNHPLAPELAERGESGRVRPPGFSRRCGKRARLTGLSRKRNGPGGEAGPFIAR